MQFSIELNGGNGPSGSSEPRIAGRPLHGVNRDDWSAGSGRRFRVRTSWPPVRPPGCSTSMSMRIEISGADAVRGTRKPDLQEPGLTGPSAGDITSCLKNPRGIESDVTVARLARGSFLMMSGSRLSGPRTPPGRAHHPVIQCALPSPIRLRAGGDGGSGDRMLRNTRFPSWKDLCYLREIRPTKCAASLSPVTPVMAVRMSYAGEEGRSCNITDMVQCSLKLYGLWAGIGSIVAGGGRWICFVWKQDIVRWGRPAR